MVRSLGLVMLFAAALGGCASAPEKSTSSAANANPAPVTAPASEAAAPAPETANVPGSAAAAPPAVVAGSTVADKPELVAAEKVPAGYKVIERDGQTLYCQSVTPLGTRFPKQVCMTHAQYKDSVYRRDQLREELTGRQKSYSTHQ